MMSSKIKLDGTLVPVGREIHAKPGQFLILAAGVCIGVYTGDANIPVAPKVIEHEPAKKQPTADKPKRKNGPSHNAGVRRYGSGSLVDGSPIRTIVPVIEAVRVHFKTHKEASVRDLRTVIGEDRVGEKAWRLRDALSWMARNGELTATGTSTNRVYYRKEAV